MGIKLNLEVETPLSDDDRDILAGISVMVLAIANRQNLEDQVQQPGEEVGPMPCGSQCEDDPTLFCVSEVGHKGRHKYRSMTRMN
jgi:hypothetical protein